jgi:hypothetical protein
MASDLWNKMFAGASGPLGVPGTPSATPTTGPDGINRGQLRPDSRAQNMANDVPYQFVPCYPPFVRLANVEGIVYLPRFRVMVFGANGTAAATTTQTYSFSNPTIVIGRSAAAILADGLDDLPVGRASLDTFKTQMFRSGPGSSDLIDAGAGGQSVTGPNVLTLGSALWGTAAQPALIQGNGLFVDTGGFLSVTCQTLFANLEVHTVIWCIEEYGPARG